MDFQEGKFYTTICPEFDSTTASAGKLTSVYLRARRKVIFSSVCVPAKKSIGIGKTRHGSHLVFSIYL